MKEKKSKEEVELNEDQSQELEDIPEEDLDNIEQYDPEGSIGRIEEFLNRFSDIEDVKSELGVLLENLCRDHPAYNEDERMKDIREQEQILQQKRKNLELLKDTLIKQKEDLEKLMVRAMNIEPVDEEMEIPDSMDELKEELEKENTRLKKKARNLKNREEELQEKEDDMVEAANPLGYINKRYKRSMEELQDEREKLMNREVRVKELEEEARRREDELHTFEEHLNKRERLIQKREKKIRGNKK